MGIKEKIKHVAMKNRVYQIKQNGFLNCKNAKKIEMEAEQLGYPIKAEGNNILVLK